jgi:ABC-type branched-subunit amino acid transport system permease subunit
VTLALSLVAQQIVIGWPRLTGGDAGLIGTPPPSIGVGEWSFVLADPVSQHYLVLAVSLIALLAIWGGCRGQYGRVLAAIRNNELRARTLGHNTSLHLLVVLMLSAALAALAGGLYAMVSGFVAPDLIGLLLSTEVIVWVAIGGRGTLIGPFVGAFVVLRLQQEVSSFNPRLWPLLIGVFFVSMVFLFPNGLLPLLERAWGRIRGAAYNRAAAR